MTDVSSQDPYPNPSPSTKEGPPEKLEGRYSLAKGGLYIAFYTLVLGGAVYLIALNLAQSNPGLRFLGFAFGLAFLYMWALQIRMLVSEARDGRATFVVTGSGIQLRPLQFATIPWEDITDIQINRGRLLPRLFGGGYIGVTIKENSAHAAALAEWNKGKGAANEFFLSANNMKLSFDELERFVKKYAR